MLNQIGDDIKEAMKAKEKEKLETLRYLKSMLLENKTSKNPLPEPEVVINLYKKLKDSIETYPEGHPSREKIQKELSFLMVYMPQQLSEEEVRQLIQEIKSKLAQPNLGAVMKELSPQIKGKFDGKMANQLVKEALE